MKHVNKLNVAYLFITSLLLSFISLTVLNATSLLSDKSNQYLLDIVPVLPQTVLGGVGMIILSALIYLVWFEYGYESMQKLFKHNKHSF